MAKATKQNKKIELHRLVPSLEKDLGTSDVVKPLEGVPSRIKHVVNIGDLYAAMGAMKKFWELTNRKIIVCQQIDFKGQYYQGAIHPTVDKEGTMVCMNDKMFEMLKPLVEAQPYIHSMEKYEGQEIHLNFDTIRNETFVNLPLGAIQQWIPLAFPDLCFDMSKAWVDVYDECPEHILDQAKGKVILNFTERYRNSSIEYFFLQNYAPDLIFAGTEKEHWLFCSKWNLNIPYLKVNNFLDLAHALKVSKFMVGNQSACWNLSESMKTPRILEVFPQAANCQIMVGENSVGFFYQRGLEFQFRDFYNRLK